MDDSESQHFAYIAVLEDILDEIRMIGDDECTKYQMSIIEGLVKIPSAIIMQKNSRFYEAVNFAATSFTAIPN